MTFTYDPASPTDITRVRFHIYDTSEPNAMFSDEEIQMVLDDVTTYQRAVIVLIEAKIAELAANPSFSADWLRVDTSSAINGLQMLLQQKKRQFGLSGLSARGVATYREDSRQTTTPDWSQYADGGLYGDDWRCRPW